MSQRYLIANWKMNLPPEGISGYLSALRRGVQGTPIIVAPPFPYIADVVERGGKFVGVAAQNCAEKRSGAFTGEVSVTMLAELGARYVIIGHSERRNLFGEGDALIARKLAMAIEAGLTPVLCIGEDQRVRDSGGAAAFVSGQLQAVAGPALDAGREVIIAYEPVWAIGTGRNATGAMVAEMVQAIRDALARSWPARYASSAPLLYGGSVTPENIADLGAHGNIDGYLVGGASLDSRKFLAIYDSLR